MQIGLYAAFRVFNLLARILPSLDVLLEFLEVGAQGPFEVRHGRVALKKIGVLVFYEAKISQQLQLRLVVQLSSRVQIVVHSKFVRVGVLPENLAE